MKKSILTLIAAMLLGSASFAQFRANDLTGINTFEAPKSEKAFEGLKTTIGGGFTQGYQNLNHGNRANSVIVPQKNPTAGDVGYKSYDATKLMPLAEGFNLASANLMLKSELTDGVALNMELYLASRHHNETWVKGGFLQFDKIPFLKWGFVDNIMKFTTIKIGQMDVNYGDAHFRRSDGGNTILNPFNENYIIDDFATEVGGEIDINYNGIIAVVGVTNGLLNGSVAQVNETKADTTIAGSVGGNVGSRKASIIGKIGYDKQITEKLRVRATVSGYYNGGAVSNTMFSGDRAGSNYFGVIDYGVDKSRFTNGRFSPGITDKVSAIMGNLFVKFHGLESFTTVEQISGRSATEVTGDRNAKQFVTDLIFRFGKNECLYIAGRFNKAISEVNTVVAVPVGSPVGTKKTIATSEVAITRVAGSIGWFITKNVLAKVEYVGQDYSGFTKSDIRNHAWFEGISAQAVIGF